MDDGGMVSRNLESLRERMSGACLRAGRRPGEVELLAVTKFQPLEAVRAAWEAGIRRFGENRVQEAGEKFPAFRAERAELRLDMIGHLQGNKVKKATALFDTVESVDSVELVGALGERAAEAGRRLDILFELHTGEESKSGFPDADALARGVEASLSFPYLTPRGLMTMAPFRADRAAVRASFRSLRSALEALRSRFALPSFTTLSMGMSGDFEIAIEEGATLVRIGTALFGGRS